MDLTLAEQDFDRGPQKWCLFPNLIFDKTQIGKMGQFRVVYMKQKGGRIVSDLGAIINLKMPSRF